MKSLNFMNDHLFNGKQRLKLCGAHSSWGELWDILYGVLQGSILGPFLFNLFLFALFYFLESTRVALHHSLVSAFLCECSTAKEEGFKNHTLGQNLLI